MIDRAAGVSGVGASPGLGASSATEANTPAAGVADDFNSLLQRTVETISKGEEVGMAGVVGAASTQEVVQAVMEAERSLQTALAVRNKVVEAYLEISRMQI